MNQIIQSYLDAHIKEYEIESYDQSTAFEHFINKCIINRLSTERFDPIVRLLTDDQGALFKNIFEDNVRDFQGYNSVNSEIKISFVSGPSYIDLWIKNF